MRLLHEGVRDLRPITMHRKCGEIDWLQCEALCKKKSLTCLGIRESWMSEMYEASMRLPLTECRWNIMKYTFETIFRVLER